MPNVIRKNPIQISGAIVAIVNFLILVDVLDWTGEQVAGLNTALVAVLGLFVGVNTVNAKKLDELDER